MKKERAVLLIIGLVSIIASLLGFWFITMTLSASVEGSRSYDAPSIWPQTPYFAFFFYPMIFISSVCHAILLWSGVEFVCNRTRLVKIFVATIIFEIIYSIASVLCVFIPKVGTSIISAAIGANGSFVFQWMLLFPLWAPSCAMRAAHLKK